MCRNNIHQTQMIVTLMVDESINCVFVVFMSDNLIVWSINMTRCLDNIHGLAFISLTKCY